MILGLLSAALFATRATAQTGQITGVVADAQSGSPLAEGFISETAVKRFTEVDAPADMMFQAHLWTGYAYSYLGRWWCDAVVTPTDPDDRTPGTFEQGTRTYLERAVSNFTPRSGSRPPTRSATGLSPGVRRSTLS